MANKGKFFSWFGKGKKQKDEQQQASSEEQSHLEQSNTEQSVDTSDAEIQNVEPSVEQNTEKSAEQKVEPVAEQEAESAPEAEPELEQKTQPDIEPVDTLVSASVATEEREQAPQIEPQEAKPEESKPEESKPEESEPEPAKKGGFFSRFSKSGEKSGEKLESEGDAKPEQKKEGFFARLKKGLSKTKENLGSGIDNLFRGKKIDDDLFEELETQLLVADVGVETSLKLVESLTDHADRKQLKDGEALYELLKQEMAELLVPVDKPLVPENPDGPYVILMVGVNGVGKTTTIGKMAKQFQQQGKSVMLAAGDTFRAAAVEQLTVWGERNEIPVIAQHTGADSASVIFDAIQAAKSRDVDVIIADTAGRLQNKDHLMEELKKIVRVMKKLDVNAPHEVMLTLDAGTGQNALSQVKLFSEAVGLTGLTLSKLDGTAKGGVVFAIADKFKIPIRYIGVGEGIDDLRTFDSKDFIEALFSHDDEQAGDEVTGVDGDQGSLEKQ